jgi:hypothetical protein
MDAKKIGLGIGATLVGVVMLGVTAIIGNFYVLHPNLRPARDVHAPTDAASLARGEYLAWHVAGCFGCHSEVDESTPGAPPLPGRVGVGRCWEKIEGLGTVCPPNITPMALGEWTDGEILRAMREGVSRDGRALAPMMPYQTFGKNLSDEDSLAIIAYLRTIEPVKNTPPMTAIDFPLSMFFRMAPKPVATPAGPQPTEPVARGNWLIQTASCAECHNTFDGQHNELMHLAGGESFTTTNGTVHAPNITSDPRTGIGAWTDDEIRNAVFGGVSKDGRVLYVMPWYYFSGMSDDDKAAVVAALRAVPPVEHEVQKGMKK